MGYAAIANVVMAEALMEPAVIRRAELDCTMKRRLAEVQTCAGNDFFGRDAAQRGRNIVPVLEVLERVLLVPEREAA